MSNVRKRSFIQILKDLFEDEALAFAMCRAAQHGDYSSIYSMERNVCGR